MTRRHGWAGDPPRTEDEAIRRIVAAAIEQMTLAQGGDISIADVAKSLGVIRQTVYRYFTSAEALMKAAAIASVEAYMTRLQDHLHGIEDPSHALLEAVAFTIEEIPRTPHIGMFVQHPRVTALGADITSKRAAAFGREMLARFDVDWAAAGFDDALLDDVVEIALRTMQSFFISPGDPPRDGAQLRFFLSRWLGGTVDVLTYRHFPDSKT